MPRTASLGLVGSDALALRLAAAARRAGIAVVAAAGSIREHNRLAAVGAEVVPDHGGFFERLEHPRLVVLRRPPGVAVDELIEAVYVHLEPGDLLADASDSYWGDSLRRFGKMRHRSLFYLDVAPLPRRDGLRLLVGGEPRGLARAGPLLRRLAGGAGLVEAGPAGAAHFLRLVRAALALAGRTAEAEARRLLAAFPGTGPADGLLARLEAEEADAPGLGWLAGDARELGVDARRVAAAIAAARPGDGAGRITGFLAPGTEA